MQKTNSKDSGSLLSQTLKFRFHTFIQRKQTRKNDKVKSKIEEDTTDAKNTLKNIKNDEFAKKFNRRVKYKR